MEAYKTTQVTDVQEPAKQQVKSVVPVAVKAKSTIQKLNSKERQELESIPVSIDALEKEQAEIGLKLGDPDLYKNQPQDLLKYQARLRDIEEQLITLMARWEDLLARSE
jgi:ATP-binding cassette subfamily F protein uup